VDYFDHPFGRILGPPGRGPSPLEFARSPAPTVPAPKVPTMQAIFYGYLTVIVAGIVFFSIVGLTHH
jgi:hypothetical protein